MSRRFGRNQRRQLRAEIASLRENVTGLNRELIYSYNKIGEYQRWVDRLKKSYGPKSDLLPEPIEQHSRYELYAPFREHMPLYLDDLSVQHPSLELEELMSHREFMRMFLIDVEANRDKYKGLVTYKITSPKGVTQYAISEDVLKERGYDEREIRWVSDYIAQELIEHQNAITNER